MAEKIMRRLRLSRSMIECVRSVITHHLRPGNLAACALVTERAAYRFLRDTSPHALSLLLVAWSDHAGYMPLAGLLRHLPRTHEDPNTSDLSSLRPSSAQKTIRHLQVVTHLLCSHLKLSRARPQQLADGHDVMRALKVKPGPDVGKALESLREAQALGRVRTREEALKFLTSLRSRAGR